MRIAYGLCLFCVLLLSGCMIPDTGAASGRQERRHDNGYAEPRYSPTPQAEPERGHSGREYRKERDNGREQGERGSREQRDETRKRQDAGQREYNTRRDESRDRGSAGQRERQIRQESDKSRKRSDSDNGQTRSSDAAKETSGNREIPSSDGGRGPSRSNESR